MKKTFKNLIASILGWQIRRLRARNTFRVVAVAGSIGKTSTKFAIAQTVSTKLQVQFQEGNYNDVVSVPLVFFGHTMPNVTDVVSWLKIFFSNEALIRRKYPYDVVVVELGTDGPGQLQQFKKYLHADIGVLTAIAPEHMEYFGTLQAVANEELVVAQLSQKLLVNTDLVDSEFLPEQHYISYGVTSKADYMAKTTKATCNISQGDRPVASVTAPHSRVETYSYIAAAAVAEGLGLQPAEVAAGLKNIQPAPGRMNRLKGLQGATIIDDTYNASPVAALAALDVLYAEKAKTKIALLGNMNELGDMSADAHKELGAYCNPKKLDLVVTLGKDANEHTAAAAEDAGCKVVRVTTPYDAIAAIRPLLNENAVLLAKGSQNGVFAEEAVKLLLEHPDDAQKLVRQSEYWLAVKKNQFGDAPS
jgi:UDP-N-acetylmuramyl pentapeptide synthase